MHSSMPISFTMYFALIQVWSGPVSPATVMAASAVLACYVAIDIGNRAKTAPRRGIREVVGTTHFV